MMTTTISTEPTLEPTAETNLESSNDQAVAHVNSGATQDEAPVLNHSANLEHDMPRVTVTVETEKYTETLELRMHGEPLEFAENVDNPSVPLTKSEPISLPAALCDDLLLDEINSIPDKMGFKIGDVAEILGIKQYVLRYWETEFEILRPKKASNNQRMYTRKDVENALLIRKLLHRDRFSIEGARNAMKELKAHVKKEKDFSQVTHKLDNVHDAIEHLVLDIRRLRQLFR